MPLSDSREVFNILVEGLYHINIEVLCFDLNLLYSTITDNVWFSNFISSFVQINICLVEKYIWRAFDKTFNSIRNSIHYVIDFSCCLLILNCDTKKKFKLGVRNFVTGAWGLFQAAWTACWMWCQSISGHIQTHTTGNLGMPHICIPHGKSCDAVTTCRFFTDIQVGDSNHQPWRFNAAALP